MDCEFRQLHGSQLNIDGKRILYTGDFNMARESKAENQDKKYKQTDLNEGDILALLDNWWPKDSGSVPENVSVNFIEVDELLSLPPGSTQKYISQVARNKGFKPGPSGNVVAVFEYDVLIESFDSTYLEPDF